MHIQQVALTLMSFSAARGGSVLSENPSGFVVSPPAGDSRIFINSEAGDAETWYVRLKPHEGPFVYFPAVTNANQLKTILARAWTLQDRQLVKPRFPVLSRFIDPPNTPPPSASPPRQRRLSPDFPPS